MTVRKGLRPVEGLTALQVLSLVGGWLREVDWDLVLKELPFQELDSVLVGLASMTAELSKLADRTSDALEHRADVELLEYVGEKHSADGIRLDLPEEVLARSLLFLEGVVAAFERADWLLQEAHLHVCTVGEVPDDECGDLS